MSSSSDWIVYSLLCLLLWGVWGFAIKIAYGKLTWSQAYMLSSLASFAVTLAFIFYLRPSMPNFNRFSIAAVVAGLAGSLGYVFFVKALERGEASIVLPLTALYPAVTVVLAFLFLHEKISMHQLIGILLAVVAVVLLSYE